MALEPRRDPFRGSNFRLEVGGLTVASFAEVSGLVVDGDAVDYREGDERQNWVRKLIGLRKQNAIKLVRGYTKWDDQPASPAAARGRLEPSRPLLRHGLVLIEDVERPLLTRGLRIPDRVAAHLLGDDTPAMQ